MKTSTLAFSVAATLIAGSACAQSALSGYTIKLGAGRVDPRATSSDLVGTLPVPSGAGQLVINLPEGNRTEVQPKSTLIFSIERALSNNWSVELVAGTPPDARRQVAGQRYREGWCGSSSACSSGSGQ